MKEKSDECNWKSVQVRTAVKNRIDDFLKTENAKFLGITNTSQFVDLVIREKLAVLEAQRK